MASRTGPLVTHMSIKLMCSKLMFAASELTFKGLNPNEFLIGFSNFFLFLLNKKKLPKVDPAWLSFKKFYDLESTLSKE